MRVKTQCMNVAIIKYTNNAHNFCEAEILNFIELDAACSTCLLNCF